MIGQARGIAASAVVRIRVEISIVGFIGWWWLIRGRGLCRLGRLKYDLGKSDSDRSAPAKRYCTECHRPHAEGCWTPYHYCRAYRGADKEHPNPDFCDAIAPALVSLSILPEPTGRSKRTAWGCVRETSGRKSSGS